MAYPILAPNSTWYSQGGTSVKRSSFTKIIILDSYTPTGEETAQWNADADNSGAIKCYIKGTELIIAGNGSGKISLNANSNSVFADKNRKDYFTKITTIDGLDVLDTSNATTMERMFGACSSLSGTLDLSSFVTNSVTTMLVMFQGCENLVGITFGTGWDTSNVTTMKGMFNQCLALKSLIVSNWNTSKVTETYLMFGVCKNLTSLDVSNWDTSSVKTMYQMFYKCSSLETLNVSGWKTDEVTDMSGMFDECSSLVTLDVSGWNTSNVTDMSYMFDECSSLVTLNVSGWKTGNVTDMSYMFRHCFNIAALDVSNWNTGNVTTMAHMFAGDDLARDYKFEHLTELDVSRWNTSNVTDMKYMFYALRNPNKNIEIDMSRWDVSKVTDFDHMFAHSQAIVKGTENLVTTSAENMNGMFHSVQNEVLDLSNFDTSNVYALTQMFQNCSKLVEIKGLNNFDTSNCKDFAEMFMFCGKLKVLDLSSFDTSKAVDGVTIGANNSTSATCKNMFMFRDEYTEDKPLNLEKIILGEKFSFNGSGASTDATHTAVLPTPIFTTVKYADGNWYSESGEAYAPADVPNGKGVYYASLDRIEKKHSIKFGTLKRIANSIRRKASTTDKILTQSMPEVIDGIGGDAYEQGMKAERDAFWDILQNEGLPMNYRYMFAYDRFNDDTYNPIHDIVCNDDASASQYMFYTNNQNRPLTSTKVGIFLGKDATQCFRGRVSLVEIVELGVRIETTFSGAFTGCESLTRIRISDVTQHELTGLDYSLIGKSIDLSPCPLDEESLKNVVSHLSGAVTGLTATFNEDAVIAAFGSEEAFVAFAADKGKGNWTISLKKRS
jgi:surface protein